MKQNFEIVSLLLDHGISKKSMPRSFDKFSFFPVFETLEVSHNGLMFIHC